jgi:DNA polymerase-4
MDRTILHCDLNGFYASVECLSRPELKNVPMAVCGSVENRRGIVLAKNELAKGFGIVTAETVWQAKKKCPALVTVPPHHSEYSRYSRIVNAIYERYTDRVEPFGIDESWLDVTGSGDGQAIADEVRGVVKQEVGLTLSVGVSFNKVFAKLGSDYKKPDATTVFSRENFREIVWPLPVSALLYAGKAATKALAALGVTTIGQLAACSREAAADRLGKLGETLHDYACGLDADPVGVAGEREKPKSVGNGMTFKRDLIGMDDIRSAVAALSDSVASRLRHCGMKCGAVQVTIRDPHFHTITRQRKLPSPTHQTREIGEAALSIIAASWCMDAPIRMLTITGLSLTESGQEQLSMFGGEADAAHSKRERIEAAVDLIRGKFGKDAISLAASFREDIGLTHTPAPDEPEE